MLPMVSLAQEESGYGSVGGIIMVWKTMVETTGPRNAKDVIVYLESDKSFPPVTDRLIQMDQRGLLFIPHVLAIQKGTSVEFLNNDSEKHNVFFLFDKTGETLDIGTWERGQSVVHTFNETGTVITLCKLHLEMAANIIILDNPYYTHAEIDGDSQRTTYRLDRVPPGEYVLKTWHKKLKMKGGEAPIKVEAGKMTKVNIAITKRQYAH
ncbi:MAG: plastocyanin/azurin family copper-binding protein [Desulfurivibrionaceae bacterium]|nr:plastocyanin/azurin family copper-binding protein [Desulfurivibrionaceae bacterium]